MLAFETNYMNGINIRIVIINSIDHSTPPPPPITHTHTHTNFAEMSRRVKKGVIVLRNEFHKKFESGKMSVTSLEFV